ncbi:cytochrome P450 [Natronomonas marina]|uniref:cytochrome P450 n=1 Tax=Natronomonas marina TaxID=2961939 RepID=UPI0020C9A7E7|nr:cytochrome P450 [Natronomonas marina]
MARRTANGREADGADAELPSETPPGPDGLPVLGNVRDLVADPRGFYEEMSEYGDVVSYSVPRMDFCTVLHPELVERVLVTDNDAFEKFGFEDLGGDFMSEGLLLAEGEQWQRQRLAAQEAFTPERIRTYGEAMGRYAEEMVDGWTDGDVVELDRAFSRLTLRILSRSLFDLELAADAEVVTEMAAAINDRGDLDGVSTFVPMWVPTPRNRRFRRAASTFEEFVDDLVAERRGSTDAYDDLLASLMAAREDGGDLSEAELRDSMATFLFAGHETTSLALTYLVLLVAQHDDVRDCLDEEYATVLGGRRPAVEDLPDLEYTGRVVDETLRLYPPAYILFRTAREDVELGGYRIPAGTNVTLPQFFVHTDERWYDDPGTFDPDRWTDGFEDSLPEYAYFPFGGGPRHCIGMRFAMQELKTVVPTVLQRVEFELVSDPDPELDMAITLRPSDPVRATVRER